MIFKADILRKNSSLSTVLEGNSESSLDVIYIDEKFKYAILKSSSNIHQTLMKSKRIYLGMESHHVSEQLHVLQCFRCQGFEHKQDFRLCPLKK